MTIEFDDKGKYFTDIISKITPIPVMLQTAPHRIHGNIHVSQDRRLKDELELPEKFIAVTDAIVYYQKAEFCIRPNFWLSGAMR